MEVETRKVVAALRVELAAIKRDALEWRTVPVHTAETRLLNMNIADAMEGVVQRVERVLANIVEKK